MSNHIKPIQFGIASADDPGGRQQQTFSFLQKPENERKLQISTYSRTKNGVERVLAAILLLPASPVIFVLCCLVRMNSRGKAIYRQVRVGKDGKEFSMYKIRTMVIDAEANSGPKWSSESDPRITSVGRILRFLHLDELPQLYNVLRGDMSVNGPRPERPDFVRFLSQEVEGYTDRLAVKPGITGLAQIYLPPDQTTDCVRKKILFDKAYIESESFLLDVKIWACTMVRILGLRKGRGPKWFGLDRRYGHLKRACDKLDQKKEQPVEVGFFRVDAGSEAANPMESPSDCQPVAVSRNEFFEDSDSDSYDSGIWREPVHPR